MESVAAYASPDSSLASTSIILALALPLISFLLSFLISEKYSWLVSFVAPFLILLSALASVIVFANIWNAEPLLVTWQWFSMGGHELNISILVDNLTVLMMVIVTIVSFLVNLYSTGYMAGDTDICRYFAMLGFFTFSMLGIVISGNLLLVFVFWELVGFSSYMLIGHWSDKPEAASAAKRAFIFNRVGDAGFLVGLMVLWTLHGSFEIHDLINGTHTGFWSSVAAFGIFCGVIGKSAQFPLFVWLPQAMEGPTPVSALIHAATMVAAGVFLLARVFFLLTPHILDVIAIIGCVSALAGALAALAQHDMKRVLAYSTISQLGFMIMAIGAGSPAAAMLHLATHAFFKACLFLSAGAVIHALHHAQHQSHTSIDVQDIRQLGGLRKKLPITFIMFAISGAALSGVPFFTGFVSKEAILDALYAWKGDTMNWRWIIFISAFAVSFLTVLYTFRLVWSIFMGESRSEVTTLVVEAPPVMRAPLYILALASLWFTVSINPFNFTGWLYNGLRVGKQFHLSIYLPIASAVWILLALYVAYVLRNRRFSTKLLYNGFYLERVFSDFVETPSFQLSAKTEQIDKRWIDGALHSAAYIQLIVAHVIGWIDHAIIDGIVNGVASMTKGVGSFTRSFQKGKVQQYIFWAAFGIIIFIIWTLL